jgi:hypothetical protein
MPNYPFSGSGRDLYMRGDFGGPIPATGKSTFSERPPVSPINSICSRTDTMPRCEKLLTSRAFFINLVCADYNDGTGRDIYLSGHLSKIPSTGKANFSERPPSKQASKRHVRTDMLPPFTPSGSGRDTFHRVEYRDKEDAWSLRSYPVDNDIFTITTPGSRARSPRSGLRSIRALEERKKQQYATARLSQPKQWTANMAHSSVLFFKAS